MVTYRCWTNHGNKVTPDQFRTHAFNPTGTAAHRSRRWSGRLLPVDPGQRGMLGAGYPRTANSPTVAAPTADLPPTHPVSQRHTGRALAAITP